MNRAIKSDVSIRTRERPVGNNIPGPKARKGGLGRERERESSFKDDLSHSKVSLPCPSFLVHFICIHLFMPPHPPSLTSERCFPPPFMGAKHPKARASSEVSAVSHELCCQCPADVQRKPFERLIPCHSCQPHQRRITVLTIFLDTTVSGNNTPAHPVNSQNLSDKAYCATLYQLQKTQVR